MMKKADNMQSIQSDLAMQLTPEPDQSSDAPRPDPQLDVDDWSEDADASEEIAERDPSNDLIDEMDDDFEFEFGDDSDEDQPADENPLGFDQPSEDQAVSQETSSVEMPEVPLQDRMIPRISIDAFCLSPDTGVTLQRVASDRRLSRAHVNVQMGGTAAAIEHYASSSTPSLVILEVVENKQEIDRNLEALAHVCDAGTKVIVVGQTNDIHLYRELMRQGVSEYLVAPLTVPQVIDSVSGLYVDPTSAPIGRTIVFTGAKGGVGSSTLAHNIAWCISERMEHDVTMVDLDLPFGTAGLDFNEDPSQGVADALMDPDRLDDQLLDRLLVKCSEHLSLFSAPGSLEREFNLSIPAFDSILDTVRGSVPCLVVDLPHVWEPWSRHILTTADEIVITATPDLASLRNAKNIVDTLKQARQNDEPPRLVLNQVGVPKRPEIPAKDFAEAIGSDVNLILPFDPQLFGTASNNGQMIGELKPDAKAAAGIVGLAKVLTNRDVVAGETSTLKKFWNQLLGK